MSSQEKQCPDCAESGSLNVDRRGFLKAAGVVAGSAAIVGGAAPLVSPVLAKEAKKKASPESLVKLLYDSLTDAQKKEVAFAWNHVEKGDKGRGLLRTRVAANWTITKPTINSDFFTKEQRALTKDIFEGIINPDWHARYYKQLEDDSSGFGEKNAIALFGKPGDGKFEFVLTGRHMTLRCDGNSADHVAFGGPIFYGHAASGFREKPDHPGNVFWEQAVLANNVYKMLDGKQRKVALLPKSPNESKVAFQGPGGNFPGIAISDLSKDQKEHVQKTLLKLIEPFRQSDREEALGAVKKQGGLDKCHLAFYADKDIGKDTVWDNWRLEGPSFVWYFRGSPHVHTWVNVAADHSVKTNS